jgi:murein DD-endopeptidase MepM/ murein hydrolase activator NlpD
MSCSDPFPHEITTERRLLGRGAVLAAALALAGCSADITRFDFPALNDGSGSAQPVPSRPIGGVGAGSLAEQPAQAPSGNSAYFPPRAQKPSSVQMSALPEAGAPAGGGSVPIVNEPPRRPAPPSASAAPAPAPIAPAPAVAGARSIAKGEQIEVQQGDTLYGLSKRHKVAIAELMQVNDLKSPALKPGQKLYLPAASKVAGSSPQKPLPRTQTAAAPAPLAIAPSSKPAPAPAAVTDWSGSYTVKPGDSPYAIAQRHKVSFAELQSANGIADPRKVKPGTVLKVPAGTGNAPAAAAPAPAAPAPIVADAPRAGGAAQPTIINAQPAEKPERVAAAAPETATDAAPAVSEPPKAKEKAAGGLGGKLRWPVKGKVIAAFGPRTDGSHNDGVNLAVPLGADVHAAEAGVVAYAGSELKGYGNLILIRHDNGWVTAYAHNDQLLVKRGDKIKRGQVVAKAGKTGTVDQPQVHFELRQGSKPIDPTPHMEKL